jgi:hypothetical protein
MVLAQGGASELAFFFKISLVWFSFRESVRFLES